MNKLLRSFWVVAGAALVINLACIGGLILMRLDEIVVLPPPSIDEMADEEIPRTYWSFSTSEIDKLVTELGERRNDLSGRTQTVETMEARLQFEMDELFRLRDEIELRQKELDATVLRIKEDEVANLKTLAKTYSEVDAEAAVKIFQEMEDSLVAKILALMKTKEVGKIFEAMAEMPDPDGIQAKRAARLSELLRLYQSQK
ncbi:MAG: MotE family protein [Verrucomicrobiota bacterium]